MSLNLIDSIKSLLSGDPLGKAAGMLGEDPGNVQRAVDGIIPSILTGVLHRAGSGDVHGVMNLAVDAAKNGIPENLGALVGSGEGFNPLASAILNGLFGDKVSGLTAAISSFSRISNKSASALLNVTAPASMAVLGKQVIDSNLNSAGLLSFLNSERDNILNALPSGLNLAGVLGFGSLSGIAGKLSGAASAGKADDRVAGGGSHATVRPGSGSRWLLPLLLMLVLIAIIWYFMNRHSPESDLPVMSDSVSVVNDSASLPQSAGPEQVRISLSDGTVLNVLKGSMEDQLVNFLNDSSSKPGKEVWFDFDSLDFKSGSAGISDDHNDQVQDMAAILKAYPKLKIKIGGYTDRAGDSLQNKKLSRDRAAAVAAAIKKAGAKPAQVTGSEGYGSAFAKAAADAPDSVRKKDRHISVNVRSK
ncbi:MAG TPA: DUF937 domain-containing protein [Puia sp.]